jgi:hypothetical protein
MATNKRFIIVFFLRAVAGALARPECRLQDQCQTALQHGCEKSRA